MTGKHSAGYDPPMPKKTRADIVREIFSELGKKGGRARAKMLSAERRQAIARKGGIARARRAAK